MRSGPSSEDAGEARKASTARSARLFLSQAGLSREAVVRWRWLPGCARAPGVWTETKAGAVRGAEPARAAGQGAQPSAFFSSPLLCYVTRLTLVYFTFFVCFFLESVSCTNAYIYISKNKTIDYKRFLLSSQIRDARKAYFNCALEQTREAISIPQRSEKSYLKQ